VSPSSPENKIKQQLRLEQDPLYQNALKLLDKEFPGVTGTNIKKGEA